MRLSWKARLWQAAGVPPWVLGRGLIRAGHAFVRLHFRLWERAVDLPPGSIVVLLGAERGPTRRGRALPDQTAPTEADWRLATAEITRLLRCQRKEDRR